MSNAEESRWKDGEPGEAEFAAQWQARLGGDQPSGCPAPGLLLAAQSDAVPEQVHAAVRSHLEQCPFCQGLLRDLAEPEFVGLTDETRQSIRAKIPNAEPPRRAKRNWWLWVAVPVAASLLIGFFYLRPAAPPVEEVAAVPEAAAPAPPEQASALLKLTKPAIQLPAAALLFRGGDEGREGALIEGIAAFRRDDYPAAARLLGRAAKQQPEIAEAHFYLGVSLLFLERGAEARAALERAEAVAEGDLGRHAAWYLAIAHSANGDRKAAAQSLERVCREAGARQDEACRALAELSP